MHRILNVLGCGCVGSKESTSTKAPMKTYSAELPQVGQSLMSPGWLHLVKCPSEDFPVTVQRKILESGKICVEFAIQEVSTLLYRFLI